MLIFGIENPKKPNEPEKPIFPNSFLFFFLFLLLSFLSLSLPHFSLFPSLLPLPVSPSPATSDERHTQMHVAPVPRAAPSVQPQIRPSPIDQRQPKPYPAQPRPPSPDLLHSSSCASFLFCGDFFLSTILSFVQVNV